MRNCAYTAIIIINVQIKEVSWFNGSFCTLKYLGPQIASILILHTCTCGIHICMLHYNLNMECWFRVATASTWLQPPRLDSTINKYTVTHTYTQHCYQCKWVRLPFTGRYLARESITFSESIGHHTISSSCWDNSTKTIPFVCKIWPMIASPALPTALLYAR